MNKINTSTGLNLAAEQRAVKRNIAYKMIVGDILKGRQIFESERLKFLEINNKQIARVNIIANVVDKFFQEGERKFATLTLDDASGQIKVKTFGDEVEKFSQLSQGDTILVIGLLRSWNNEIYVTPEIIKKKSPAFLLIRKLEIEAEKPKEYDEMQIVALKDKIMNIIKNAEKDGGVNAEKVILELKESPDVINQEIKHLLENGIIYEPRPGKLRWLG